MPTPKSFPAPPLANERKQGFPPLSHSLSFYWTNLFYGRPKRVFFRRLLPRRVSARASVYPFPFPGVDRALSPILAVTAFVVLLVATVVTLAGPPLDSIRMVWKEGAASGNPNAHNAPPQIKNLPSPRETFLKPK